MACGSGPSLAAAPTAAIGLAKRSINQAEEAELAASLAFEAALQDVAGRTDDHAEGLAAFAEKRDPRFTGRRTAVTRPVSR